MSEYGVRKGEGSPVVKAIMVREDGTSMEFDVANVPFLFGSRINEEQGDDNTQATRVMLGNGRFPDFLLLANDTVDHIGSNILSEMGITSEDEVKDIILTVALVLGLYEESWEANSLITMSNSTGELALAAMRMASEIQKYMLPGERILETVERLKREFFGRVMKDPEVLLSTLRGIEEFTESIASKIGLDSSDGLSSMISDYKSEFESLIQVIQMMNTAPAGTNQ